MLTIDSELVRLLMRAGYLATWNGLYREAITIFDAVRAIRPQSEMPVIGGAVVAMLNGEPDLAVRTLEEIALELNPQSAMSKAHLGCALRLMGQEEEGIEILREVREQCHDPDAADMAVNILNLSAEQLKPSLQFS